MDGVPDKHLCLLAAETMGKRLRAMSREIPGVHRADDVEPVHHMRVASRRLRSALEVFADCFPAKKVRAWRKAAKRVTGALGQARDLDVQIQFLRRFLENLPERKLRPGVERVLLRLRQQRLDVQPDLEKALDRWQGSDARTEPAQVVRRMQVAARKEKVRGPSPEVYRKACQAVLMRLEEMLAYEAFARRPDQVEKLHELRIAAKRLRYTLEVFEPVYDRELTPFRNDARLIQDQLGSFHDCFVWLELLRGFLEAERARAVKCCGHLRGVERLLPGIDHLSEDRSRQMKASYDEFVAFWDRLEKEKRWEELRAVLVSHLRGSAVDIRPPETAGPEANHGNRDAANAD